MKPFGFPFALILVIFAALLIWFAHEGPPAAKSRDAPANEFSAARAVDDLKVLLGDERPHPVGTPENDAVRARLITRLQAIGLEPTIQTTVGCSPKWPACGRVTNVLAALPGSADDTILLMSHYDSVAAAPGAGDDGAGVATLLEAGRILKAGAPYKNTVAFLFTDAEEDGLLGAEAFFAEHPAAKRIKVVFNLEGSGSTGVVLLLRAGPDSGHLVRTYRESVTHPQAASFAQEVFKRMPNDTDFSVAMRAGIPGIDFAFVGERGHYHTPLDSIAKLNPATVQHHGDSLLPVVRRVLDADLDAKEADVVFASQPGGWWLSWKVPTGTALAVACVALLAFATWRHRREFTVPRLLVGLGLALLVLVTAAAVEMLALWATDRLAGTRVAWPANPVPWRLVIYAVPVLVLTLIAPALVRWTGFWGVYLGSWWWWALATATLAVYMPLALHLLLPPALLAAVVGAFAPRPHNPLLLSVITAAVAGFFMLPLAPTTESSLGLELAPVMFGPLAWLAMALLPVLAVPQSRDTRPALAASALAIAAGLIWSAFVPLYSPDRPQHVTFHHQLNADTGHARVVVDSPNPPSGALLAAAPFQLDQQEGPWSSRRVPATPMPTLPAIPPALFALDDGDGDPKTRRARLCSSRHASRIMLGIPRAAGIHSIAIDGRPVGVGEGEYATITFVNPPSSGFVLDVALDTADPVRGFVLDATHGVPDTANELVAARGTLAVPAHDGDRSLIYRTVEF